MTRFLTRNALVACVLLSGLHTVAQAHGGFKCDVPSSEWQRRDDLQEKLKKKGWEIRTIKIENGCYEVYGFDKQGKRKETYFNPKTFEIVGEVPQDK